MIRLPSSVAPLAALVVVTTGWLLTPLPLADGAVAPRTVDLAPASGSVAGPARAARSPDTAQPGRVAGGAGRRAGSLADAVARPGWPASGTAVGALERTTPAGEAGRVPRGRWQWPLSPRPAVARPFVPPRSTWGPGHRGVDLAAVVGQPVRAVADGAVTHVGVIAGRPTLTVTHPDGLRSTYEPVQASVHPGDRVTAGQVVGAIVGSGSHCSPTACLHLGALRGGSYVDPLALLGPVRVRLLPLGLPGS